MIKIVFIDLDGTLLQPDGTISSEDRLALQRAGDAGIIRVAATGRSLYTLRRVILPDDPLDYYLISSGAGVWDCSRGRLCYEQHLDAADMQQTAELLLQYQLPFMVHDPLPDNHYFQWFGSGDGDFKRRIELYQAYGREGKLPLQPIRCSQLLAILHPEQEELLRCVEQRISGVKVIRATSPLDGRSIWMELFPQGVSKGHTAQWLCEYLGIKQEESLSIGNDYNDVDMLRWTAQSYVVANAPRELHAQFKVTRAHTENGVSKVLTPLL